MAESKTGPKVDGDLVALSIEDSQLRWIASHADHEDPSAEWTTIALKSIIAAVPSPSQVNEHTLLYTAASSEAGDADNKTAPLLLKSARLTDFPRSFLDSQEHDDHGFGQSNANSLRGMQTINIIVSTGSGTRLAAGVWERLLQPLLRSLGLTAKDYDVHHTTSESSVMELAQTVTLPIANNGRNQLIIILSGDGGIVDIVNTLLSENRSSIYQRPTLALLPLGTGNALANSAVVGGDDDTMGLRALIQGSSRQLPLFRATFSPGARLLTNEGRDEQQLHGSLDGKPVAYGAVVCSWGLHAALVADSDTAEYRKFGAERFKMAAKEAFFPSEASHPHAYRGRVSVLRSGTDKWEEIPRTEHGYILATLVSHLEAGFTISPDSSPLDGELRLVEFGHVSGQEAMEIMTKAYQGGKHKEDDRVGYEKISGLRIHFDEDDGQWRRICIDGKIIRVEKGGWVEVMKEEQSVVDLVARKG